MSCAGGLPTGQGLRHRQPPDQGSETRPAMEEQALCLSGGYGTYQTSARAGYLPISLRYVPNGAFEGIPIHLRHERGSNAPDRETFALYRSADVPFTDSERRRLIDGGTRFVYIRIADQVRFREQSERSITETVADPSRAIEDKSTIVYETGVALINELLAEPELVANSARVRNMSCAIATLVLSDDSAFSHLFAASRHDFYTATHMVNVATWMVPLAHALGIRDRTELERICQAGLLHDVGKIFIPEEILNKRGRLTSEDWQLIRSHPGLGAAHLESFDAVHPDVLTVIRRHHERTDGGGYPNGLKADQIDLPSRICAVVDSFDAMTAFRPFKERTMSVADAVRILRAETPERYDPEVMEAWLELLGQVKQPDPVPEEAAANAQPRSAQDDSRGHERFRCDCPARIHVLTPVDGGMHEAPGTQVTVHSVSRYGLGFLSHVFMQPGEYIRAYLMARTWAGRFVHGQVVRCRTYRDGWYDIGAELFPTESDAPEA